MRKNNGPINSMDEARDFWETCHQKESVVHLSGVQYDQMIQFMKLEDFIRPGETILETGDGMGYVTKGLQDAGLKVSAIDISKTALDRVDSYCEKTYLVDVVEGLPSDYFDIILCCNMVQHVHTDLLKRELENFMRSLKDDGVLAIQFVSNRVHPDMGIAATLASVQAGILCRSPGYLEAMINDMGGECKLVVDIHGLRKGKVNGNHVFHVTKAAGKKKVKEEKGERKSKKDKKKEKNPGAQIRSTHGYNNPHDY